jgi:osmotically-inducible protein OsmY
MKSNHELQRDVEYAIKWEPLMHEAEIGVSAKDGVVSLTGVVDSYVKKMEAENAAKRVLGVRAVVENIEVKLPSSWTKTDEEVAKDVLAALVANYSVPDEKIKVKVEKGWVTLEGDVSWNYQKEAALNATRHLYGVRGVSNNIELKPAIKEKLEEEAIRRAIRRNWSIDNSIIHVTVDGTTVTLTGKVDSWYQKEEAGRIAWNTPGIWHLNNELEVYYEYAFS